MPFFNYQAQYNNRIIYEKLKSDYTQLIETQPKKQKNMKRLQINLKEKIIN